MPPIPPEEQDRALRAMRDVCAHCGEESRRSDPLVLANGSRVHQSHTMEVA